MCEEGGRVDGRTYSKFACVVGVGMTPLHRIGLNLANCAIWLVFMSLPSSRCCYVTLLSVFMLCATHILFLVFFQTEAEKSLHDILSRKKRATCTMPCRPVVLAECGGPCCSNSVCQSCPL